VGVFACVLPDAFLVRPDAETEVVEAIAAELEIPAVYTTIGGSEPLALL
jgi:eIF-6 family.